MNIYGLLDEMQGITGKLEEAAASLHDKNERLRMEDFPKQYNMLDYQIRNQLRLISLAMMNTDIDISDF